MPVTQKKKTGKRKKKKKKVIRRARTKNGQALIVDLAHFLNLDLTTCDIQKRWHYFQSWPRLGIPRGITDVDRKRYAELKLLVSILEEKDIQPGDPRLIENLQNLQDEIKTAFKPILRTSLNAKERDEINYGVRRGMESIMGRLNWCTFSPKWALYAENVDDNTNSLEGWHCTYDPERSNDIAPVDGRILSQERVLHLGDYRFVVKEVSPRPKSIADRLYWFVGQTLIRALISRLKTCVECGKYFSAYDSKQVVCGNECRKQHNRKGTAERVRRSRALRKRRLQPT
jgi:hypothetical protein